MRHNYTEEETTEQAALYALGSLTQFEARLFEEHLDAGCETCSAELESFDAVVEQLAWAEASHPPPVEVREKLLARISFVAPSPADAKAGEATTAALPPLATVSSPEQALTGVDISSSTGSPAESPTEPSTSSTEASAEFSAPPSATPSTPASTQPSAPSQSEAQAVQSAPPSGVLTVQAGTGEWEETEDAGVLVKHLFADEEHDTFTTLIRMSPGARVPRHRHRGVEQCLVVEGDLLTAGRAFKPGDFICALPGSVHEELTTEQGNLLLVVAPESYEVLPPKPQQAGQEQTQQ
jgi:quercetin dioxygenase-like cupin family protein